MKTLKKAASALLAIVMLSSVATTIAFANQTATADSREATISENPSAISPAPSQPAPLFIAEKAPSIDGKIPTPEIVRLKEYTNELFEVVEEISASEAKISCVDVVPREGMRGVMTEHSAYIVPDYVKDNKLYTDGYTAKQIYGINFEYSDSLKFLKNMGIIEQYPSPDIAHLRANIYYNYGYMQFYSPDKEFLYYGCYNPFTNIIYMYPGTMTHIDNDGIAYLYDKDTVYKVKFKPTIISVLYNGKRIGFDQLPVIENGRTLVPVRAIFEKIGASILWDNDTRTVTAKKDDITITLTIDKTTATKNGQEIPLDVPAKIIGGRTLVPVRFVSDCFNVDVKWDGTTRTVKLTSK